ncbi:MAG: hypothetical protein ACC656_09920, partial [Candidatus Heimdallarchaeota archaeon]
IIEIIDATPPIVRGQPDFSYEEDSVDNYISWTVRGDPRGTYQIYEDDEIVDEGVWTDGDTIEINIDELEKGRYEYEIIFTDEAGNSKSDTVIVYVIPDEDDIPKKVQKLPGFEMWFSILGLIGISTIIRKRKST